MSNSEITRSELVRGMVEVSNVLAGPKPIDERIRALFEQAASVLDCDHVVVMQVQGDHYIGVFQYGLPKSVADHFVTYQVSRSTPIASQIEACDSYLLFHEADSDPNLRTVASAIGAVSGIIVPFTHPNGDPFGYLTAGYAQEKCTVSVDEAELAMGVARLAQATMLREAETQRHRELSRAMLQVADSERRKLSRDIHDDPLQRILGLRIGLEGYREQLTDPHSRAAVESFIEQCRSASASLREVMLQTHPNESELTDLEEALSSMVDRKEFGSNVQLRFNDARSTASPSHLVPALNRVAEQAAANTLRHAHATVLRVTFANKRNGTLLTVSDDGIGFDTYHIDPTRLGLVSMRERTEVLGGSFSLDSLPGAGTTVTAWFPHTELDPVD